MWLDSTGWNSLQLFNSSFFFSGASQVSGTYPWPELASVRCYWIAELHDARKSWKSHSNVRRLVLFVAEKAEVACLASASLSRILTTTSLLPQYRAIVESLSAIVFWTFSHAWIRKQVHTYTEKQQKIVTFPFFLTHCWSSRRRFQRGILTYFFFVPLHQGNFLAYFKSRRSKIVPWQTLIF